MSKTTIFQARLREFEPVDGGGINLDVKSGRVRDDNTITEKADQTVALTDNTTNFVEIDNVGAATANTSAFTAGSIPIATVVTASGDITSITDKRAWVAIGGGATFGDTPSTVEIGDAASEGASSNSARGDHGHAVGDPVAPPAITNPQTATEGSSVIPMRSDAKPGVPTPATPTTQAFSDAASSGAGTGFATDTHLHGMPADPGGGGAWEFVETLTASGSTSLSSSTLPTDADVFMIVLDGVFLPFANTRFGIRHNAIATSYVSYMLAANTHSTHSNTTAWIIHDGTADSMISGTIIFDRLQPQAGSDQGGPVFNINSSQPDLDTIVRGFHTAGKATWTTFTFIATADSSGNFTGKFHLFKLTKQ